MAKLHLYFVIVVLLCLSAAQFGAALRCYQCSTIEHEGCEHLSGVNISPRECLANQVCVKFKTPIIETTNRGCQNSGYCSSVREFADHCSECSTDLCNSASVTLPSLSVIGFVIIKNYLL